MAVCVIPARGGSKRIPHKNIKSFCGQPMIAWSINAARGAGVFDRIVVSTDDDQIAQVAQSCYGIGAGMLYHLTIWILSFTTHPIVHGVSERVSKPVSQ